MVSRILTAMGHSVYDCDSRARAIIDSDSTLLQDIARHVTPGAIAADGTYDRAATAAAVFAGPEKLKALNTLVHSAVIRDFNRWAAIHSGHIFVETAILRSSGLWQHVDNEWHITAPDALRIERVMARNSTTADAVSARIAAQQAETPWHHRPVPCVIMVNDGRRPLLPQILQNL